MPFIFLKVYSFPRGCPCNFFSGVLTPLRLPCFWLISCICYPLGCNFWIFVPIHPFLIPNLVTLFFSYLCYLFLFRVFLNDFLKWRSLRMNNYNLFFFIIEFLTHFVKIDSSLLTNSISIHFLGCFKIEVNFNFFIAVNHHLKLDFLVSYHAFFSEEAQETQN